MNQQMNERARQVMAWAEEEARAMGHEYVGTEHVLLGLLREGTVGRALGVESDRVRDEVMKLVRPVPGGAEGVALRRTPRAEKAVELAGEDARVLGQGSVGPEHLMIGLMREGDGVAALVLATMGVDVTRVYAELMKARLEQLKVVERAVRPVRCEVKRKRRMREELLAHLTAIYEEELASAGDPVRATEAARKRFGDPAELAKELDAAVPAMERWGYAMEKRFGWRPPESALRYVTRQVGYLYVVLGVVWLLAAVTAWRTVGVTELWMVLRGVTAVVVLTPVCVFVIEVLYYRIRDSLWGVFGSRRSMRRVVALHIILAASMILCGAAFSAAAVGPGEAGRMLLPYCVLAVWVVLITAHRAATRGRLEIADTVWACLET